MTENSTPNTDSRERSTEADKARALIFFEQAAEQGLVDAQMNCAALYYSGEGTAKNRERALMWYRKAAAQGNKDAAAIARKLGGYAP